MSKKGGYLIIDLENIDLLQTNSFSNEKVKTLYKLIESNYHKSVIISGITINSIEKNDCITNIYHNYDEGDDAYTFKIYGLYVWIAKIGGSYSIYTDFDYIDNIVGQSDESGVIKISYSDFRYKDNLCLYIEHTNGNIMVKYNVIGVSSTGYIVYNDGTVKINLNSQESTDYYTLTVTGGTVNNLSYKIFYLG